MAKATGLGQSYSMQENSSLFAIKLRQWRTERGVDGRLTQEALAEILDMSVDAIGKYERSVSYIRGDLEHRLGERLGWSAEEISACRADWDARTKVSPNSRYRLLDQAQLDAHFNGSWREASLASIAMAGRAMSDLPPELDVNEDVFGPIYETFHDHWSAVLRDGRMVAKWTLPFLLPEDETKFREGRLIESEYSVDRVRRALLPGTYYGYCPALVVLPGHEAVGTLLLSSFTRFLEGLADRGILLHGMGTVSVSPSGEQICRDLGMIRLRNHCLNAAFGVWELPGDRFASSPVTRRNPKLSRIYSERFES